VLLPLLFLCSRILAENKKRAGKEGVFQPLIRTMETYIANPHIQEHGCAVLKNLVEVDDEGKMTRDVVDRYSVLSCCVTENVVLAGQHGAIQATLKAMQRYFQHVVIQRYGCKLLYEMTRNNTGACC